ncbi:YmjE family protein, partial [Escherichia sp. TWPC-MK]
MSGLPANVRPGSAQADETTPHGEGGCVCAPPATDWTPPPLLPLL